MQKIIYVSDKKKAEILNTMMLAFPDYDDPLLKGINIPLDFYDSSFAGDICPSITSNNENVEVFLDYKNPQIRQSNSRFSVNLRNRNSIDTYSCVFDGDSWADTEYAMKSGLKLESLLQEKDVEGKSIFLPDNVLHKTYVKMAREIFDKQEEKKPVSTFPYQWDLVYDKKISMQLLKKYPVSHVTNTLQKFSPVCLTGDDAKKVLKSILKSTAR